MSRDWVPKLGTRRFSIFASNPLQDIRTPVRRASHWSLCVPTSLCRAVRSSLGVSKSLSRAVQGCLYGCTNALARLVFGIFKCTMSPTRLVPEMFECTMTRTRLDIGISGRTMAPTRPLSSGASGTTRFSWCKWYHPFLKWYHPFLNSHGIRELRRNNGIAPIGPGLTARAPLFRP